ncbi:MAG: CbrC family protein [Gammaproteobacteria bacterium]
MNTDAVSSVRDLDASLCPWCIADGTAHETLGAEFVAPSGIGDYGRWDTLPREVIEEASFRDRGGRLSIFTCSGVLIIVGGRRPRCRAAPGAGLPVVGLLCRRQPWRQRQPEMAC